MFLRLPHFLGTALLFVTKPCGTRRETFNLTSPNPTGTKLDAAFGVAVRAACRREVRGIRLSGSSVEQWRSEAQCSK